MRPPPEPTTTLPPGDVVPSVPLRGGWRIIADKELADHLHSLRFLLLMLGLGLAAVASVVATSGGIRDLAPAATGSPAIFLKLFTVGSDNLPPLVTWIAFLGPLLGIAFGFDAINGERAEGTLPRLAVPAHLARRRHQRQVRRRLSRPSRSILGVDHGASSPPSAIVQPRRRAQRRRTSLRLGVWYLVAVVYVGFWLALATLFSVVLPARRSVSPGGPLRLAHRSTVLRPSSSASSPMPLRHYRPTRPPTSSSPTRRSHQDLCDGSSRDRSSPRAPQAILDPSVRDDRRRPRVTRPTGRSRRRCSFDQSLLVVWPQVVVLVALTVACFALAYVAFMRQEVRA